MTRSRLRALLVPFLTTLAMLPILIGLGVWQLHRLAWKTALLHTIERAEAQPAVPLSDDPATFAKVRATGTWRADLQAFYGAEVRETRRGAQLGAHLVMPLARAGAPALLVDRGWVPMTRSEPIATPPGEVTVEGYVHQADRAGMFSATDDPVQRRFYTLDPATIGAALGLDRVAPFSLVALGEAPRGTYPDPARRLPRPPNDHLQYAITWFGFALILLAIFGEYARRSLKRGAEPADLAG